MSTLTYTENSRTTQVKLTITDGTYNYATQYNYDSAGNITGLSLQASKASDNSYQGNMSLSDNGGQNVNLISGADLATHVTNFGTVVTKIKADVAAAIKTS